MVLVLNLAGAFTRLHNAKTGRERLKALNLITTEFYKSLAILLYARYSGLVSQSLSKYDDDIVMLVRNQFASPTLQSWIELGKICNEALIQMGDIIVKDYTELLRETLDEEDAKICTTFVSLIDELAGNASLEDHSISYPLVTKCLLTLVDLSKAEVLIGAKLNALTKTGIHKILQRIIERLLHPFDVHFVIPTVITKEKAGIIRIYGGVSRNDSVLHTTEYERFLYYCYINYSSDEDLFMYRTSLLHFDEEDSSLSVFLKFSDGIAIYEHISLEGNVKTKTKEFPTFDDVFDLPYDDSLDYDTYQTLTQRFGKPAMQNEIVHNLENRLDVYVRRPLVEEELRKKLSHRRMYITTLDGGGGFGKTELARSVVWDLIESSKDTLPDTLKFHYVIWVTGKIDYYRGLRIERKAQQFRTVEDLVDSILFITNNESAIFKSLPTKKRLVIEALNQSKSTLLLLDNLETVSEKEDVWDFIIELGDKVRSELKVLTTSRIRIGRAELVVRLGEMELDEAEELVRREIQLYNLPRGWSESENIQSIVEVAARIPFLIHHVVNLISRGNSLTDISSRLKEDPDRALDFICQIQWGTLDNNAKKLLCGISYWGRRLSFPQAKLLCELSDSEFQTAKEQLVLCSFLKEDLLLESTLDVLPPIAMYSASKLNEHPEFKKQFIDNESMLRTPESISPVSSDVDFTEEIALNQIFQRTSLLVKQGQIDLAHNWLKQATNRFPKASSAWKELGAFEYTQLRDYRSGNESYRRASLLDSTDSLVFEEWGFMEYEKGRKLGELDAISKSVRLYDQAYTLAKVDEDRKRLRQLMAESEIELARISLKMIQKVPQSKKREMGEKKDNHYIRAIDILETNLYDNAETLEQRIHNGTVYNLLSLCFLSLMPSWVRERDLLDSCAIFYLIRGFKVDSKNRQLRYTLKHPKLLNALQRYGKKVDGKSMHRDILICLLDLEEAVIDSRQKASTILRRSSHPV